MGNGIWGGAHSRPSRCSAVIALTAVALTCSQRATAGEAALAADESEQPQRPATAQLSWDPRAEQLGCASAAQVGADVTHLLGRSALVAQPPADLHVTVRLERSSPGWVGHLSLRDSTGAHLGDRVLHSMEEDCASLDGPMALVIALLLESTQPQTTLRLPAPRKPAPQIEPVDADGERWRAMSAVAVTASGGLLPGFAVGGQLSLGVVPPGFVPVRVAATLWPGAENVDAGRGGDFSAWLAGIGLCPTLAENHRAGVGVCIGAEAGMMSATGVGLDYTHSPSRPLVQARADLGAWVRMAGPFFVGFQAGAAVPFIRARFVYTAEGGVTEEVHRPWPVVPQGALRLGFVIPPPESH